MLSKQFSFFFFFWIQIENFTVSFSDGRALCYLLHHYHPSLLPASLIKQQTSLTCNPGVNNGSDSEEEQDVALNSWITTLSPGERVDGDSANYYLAYEI